MQNPKRKKNYKPLIALFIFLAGFGLFAYFITSPSTVNTAITKVEESNNIEDVKQYWYKYKDDLSGNLEFITAIRKKLSSFDPGEHDIENAKKWLPKAPEYLNIIIVPDLSRRITDTVNNPEQISNDTMLLNHIWNAFQKAVRFKTNTRDRLLTDVTDNEQAGGKFRMIANQLIFDLSDHKNQSNRLYFEKVGNRFQNNISQLYALAKKQPLGADYWSYFQRNLARHLKKSTLEVEYRNILFIITDGYLETEHISYTGDMESRKQICKEKGSGMPLDEIFRSKNLTIPPVNTDLSSAEILIIEVNERKSGSGCDYDIIKQYWTDWIQSMHVKNAQDNFFIARQDATDLTKKEIDALINK